GIPVQRDAEQLRGDDLGLIETGLAPDGHEQILGPALDVEGQFAFGLASRGNGLDGHGKSPRRAGWSAVQCEDNAPGAQTGRTGAAPSPYPLPLGGGEGRVRGAGAGVAGRRCRTGRISGHPPGATEWWKPAMSTRNGGRRKTLQESVKK